jgi:hypothetical protein
MEKEAIPTLHPPPPPQAMPRARHSRTRITRTLYLVPRGARIEIEYNPRRPSIQAIVYQVRTLGYRVCVGTVLGEHW